jgi:hypothetical protein
MSDNQKFDWLVKELALQRGKMRAVLGTVPPPSALVTELHNIPFNPGDRVIDIVTGEEGVILGGGVENVPSEGA